MEQLAQETANLLNTSAGLLVLVLGAVAGLIIGLLFAAFGWKRKDDAVTNNRVESVQAELKDYKNDVNQHFAKTATLVNQLTNDYRAVYEHLANSSAKLCDADELNLGFDETPQLAQQDITEQASANDATVEASNPKTDADSNKVAEAQTQKTAAESQPEAAVAASIPNKIPATEKVSTADKAKPN